MLGTFTPESLKKFAEANGFDTENADFSEGVFDFKVCSTPKGETYGIPNSSKCAAPNREIASKDKKGGFLGIGQNTDVRHLPFKDTDPVLQRAENFFKSLQDSVRVDWSDEGFRTKKQAKQGLKTIDTMKKWSKAPLTQGQARILAQAYRDVKNGVKEKGAGEQVVSAVMLADSRLNPLSQYRNHLQKNRMEERSKEQVVSAVKLAQSRLNDAKMTAEGSEAAVRKQKEMEARAKAKAKFDALSPAEKKKFIAAKKKKDAAKKQQIIDAEKKKFIAAKKKKDEEEKANADWNKQHKPDKNFQDIIDTCNAGVFGTLSGDEAISHCDRWFGGWRDWPVSQ